MKCKNLTLRPSNKNIRYLVGAIDKCKYFKQVKGVNINILSKQTSICPFIKICKHYEE